MAAAFLERELTSLHVGLTGLPPDRAQSATGGPGSERHNDPDATLSQKAIANIAQTFHQEIPAKDQDYCLSLIFDLEAGVITFLKKSLPLDEFQDCRAQLLETIEVLCVRYGKKLRPYCVDIKNICLSLYTRDKSSKVKNLSLSILIQVLYSTAGSKFSEEFDIVNLFEKFFLELTKSASKLGPTVKGNLYHILGVFSELYPELVTKHAEKLLDVYASCLKTEMMSKTKKPEMSIISGCMQGLTCHLINFTHAADEGAKHAYDIFKMVRMALDPDIKHSRYDMLKAALTLLDKHACQFGPYLMDEYQKLYRILKFWSRHHNREAMHAGSLAFESFLKQISTALVTRASRGSKETECFMFFIQEFREILNNAQSTSKEISLAIRGYGLLAAPCKVFLTESDVRFMFTEMMNRSEQIYFQDVDSMEDRLINLPSFIEAFASIIGQLDQMPETFLSSLERLVVVLIEHHPRLHFRLHFTAFLSILRVYYAIASQGSVLQPFIASTMYQGLIRTCSHQVVLEMDTQTDMLTQTDAGTGRGREEDTQTSETPRSGPQLSYKNFLDFWKTLLRSHQLKELSTSGLSVEERQVFSKSIYDELLTAVLRVFHRLDLTATQTSSVLDDTVSEESKSVDDDLFSEDLSSDPVHNLTANRPKDIVIFINLVDFLRDVLLEERVELFSRWMYKFGEDLIKLSTKYPLLSGLYKLLTVCMQLCTKLKYFSGLSVYESSDGGEDRLTINQSLNETKMEFQDGGAQSSAMLDVDVRQRQNCLILFSKFTKEVVTQSKQYSGDLLVSCLVMIISVPDEILAQHLDTIIPSLQKSLTLGNSYLPLATVALDSLERWCRTIPALLIEPHYKHILPYLDPYLKSTQILDVGTGSTVLQMTTKSANRKLPIKILKQKMARDRNAPSLEEETELMVVKRQCVRLLGQVGGSNNNKLVFCSSRSQPPVAWCCDLLLRFDIPFIDMKPTIYLDIFLPRVAELADISSDRRTKVAACELLHSLVLYLIGRGASQLMMTTAVKSTMEPLYRKLLPVLMRLSCDIEQVARQLFEPLMMQLIHWLTGKKMAASPDTQALLDAIMDGLVNADDTQVRDFSGRCLREFVHWSIKQNSKEEMERSMYGLKSMLKRLFSFAKHPSSYKRLGAAIAFNNIYTLLREEQSVVDTFIFEILDVYVESLAMSDNDDKSTGTQHQCSLVLDHVERIIRVKAKLLTTGSKLRRQPRGWTGCDIKAAVHWLLVQCGKPQTECRHMCMKLVFSLALLVPGIKTQRDLFADVLKSQGVSHFIAMFERQAYQSAGNQGGLAVRLNTFVLDGPAFSLKSVLNWFKLVLTSLDCYTWVFQTNLLDPLLVFSHKNESALFDVLTHFFSDIAKCTVVQLAQMHASKKRHLADVTFTPREVELFNHEKCTVLVRAIDFLRVMLGKFSTAEVAKIFPDSFWNQDLWCVLIAVIIEPTTLGFNMADIEVMTRLPEQTTTLLNCIKKHNSLKADLCKLVLQHIDKFNIEESLSSLSTADTEQLRFVAIAYGQLHTAGFISDANRSTVLSSLLLKVVYESVAVRKGGRVTGHILSPELLDLANQLLKLGLVLDGNVQNLLEILLGGPTTSVASSSTVKTESSSPNQWFYSTFRLTIDAHLLTNADTAVALLLRRATSGDCTLFSLVGNILCGMLETVIQDVSLRHKCGKSVSDCILFGWDNLQSFCTGNQASLETKQMVLNLLTKIILVNVDVNKHDVFRSRVYSMYCNMLTDKKTSLSFKTKVLDLLAFFVTLTDTMQLKQNLDVFVSDNFPLTSTEYPVGSLKYTEYVGALNKLLIGLELSGSPMLLELLISVMCREARHVCEDDIQASLARFVRRLSADKLQPLLDLVYSMCIAEQGLTAVQRRAVIDRVCLSVIRVASTTALLRFYADHIVEVISKVESKIMRASEMAIEIQLTTMIFCYQLLEVMYTRLNRDQVHSKNSFINQAYCSSVNSGRSVEVAGKEMTTAITKLTHAVRAEDMRGNTMCIELYRQYHCTAYNTLIAVISRTQTDLKFYNVFLFTETPSKGQFLWDNLIDSSRRYEFPIELEMTTKRRKNYVTMRQELSEVRHAGHDDGDVMSASQSVHYLASSYLADSSLNSDVSQFDFASSVSSMTRLGYHTKVKKEPTEVSSGSSSSQEGQVPNDEVLELEMDDLNQHECMAPLIALLFHINKTISPPASAPAPPVAAPATQDASSAQAAMPTWMENMNKKIVSTDCTLNIKLFIAKLIVNCEAIFRPYAGHWLSLLVNLVTSAEVSLSGLHSFATDVIVTVLSWHAVAIPPNNASGREIASRLVHFLAKNCHHDNRSVLRNNLEVMKALHEVWGQRLNVPTKTLFENFSERDPKSKRNVTGVQMVGVVIANKLIPFREGEDVSKEEFYRFLALNLTNDHKHVYSATAEVIGMLLKLVTSSTIIGHDKNWREEYLDNIGKLLLNAKLDQMITCIHHMQMHYPEVSDRFMSKIMFVLPKVFGIFRTHCLEIILNRASHIENLFVELKSKGFIEMLVHRDTSTQHTALRLVQSMLPELTLDQLAAILPNVAQFTSNASIVCRMTMYNIFIGIYEKFSDNSAGADDILVQSKEILLRGLSDEDESNRLRVQNFWSHPTRLPTPTVERLVRILEAMYCPDTEPHYLAYATNFVLEMTSRSPDYNRPLFDQPLADCKFVDYTVEYAWKQRHAAMTPLFVDTQLSQTQAGGMARDRQSMQDARTLALRTAGGIIADHDLLRQTQVHQSFTPTQASGARVGVYNWLTQSGSLDTYAADFSESGTELAQSSLLFTIGAGDRRTGTSSHRAYPYIPRPVAADFGKGKLGQDMSGYKQRAEGQTSKLSEATGDFLHLKKRFFKSREQDQRVFFIKRSTRINEQREIVIKEQQSQREHQVTMYRKYRSGDLPDIQINYSAIIAPLQALAQRDQVIAKQLFSALVKAILVKMESEKAETDWKGNVSKMNIALGLMLGSSVHYCPPFIASLLDIAYNKCDVVKLQPSIISQASLASMLQPLGILVLEESFIRSDYVCEPATKRSRRDMVARRSDGHCDGVEGIETEKWLELCRLYKSLSDYDVLRGIVADRLSGEERTKDAIKAEMKCDFQAAAKIYTQGLMSVSDQSSAERVSESEVDFWEESRLQCYERLGQWDKLERSCVARLGGDNIEDNAIWEDATLQDVFLPAFIRSKLKLLLGGADQQALLSFIDSAVKNTERKALLERGFCEELSLLYLWQEDYERANHYANITQDVFLQDWCSLDDLMSVSRAVKLQSIQRMVELNEFLILMKTFNSSDADHVQRLAESLACDWMKRLPDKLSDSTSIWDDVITNRCVYLDHIAHRVAKESLQELNVKRFVSQLTVDKLHLRLHQVDASIKQNNLQLALQLLKSTQAECRACGDSGVYLTWAQMYASVHVTRCRISDSHLSTSEKIKALHGAKQLLEKAERNTDGVYSFRLKQNLLLSDIVGVTSNIFRAELFSMYSSLPTDVRDMLSELSGAKTDSPQELLSSLIEKGFQYTVSVVSPSSSTSSTSDCWSTEISAANMALYHYCDKLLRLQENEDDTSGVKASCPSEDLFPSSSVTSLLRAMKYSSKEARQLFPRLLQIVAKYPKSSSTFIAQSKEVASWQFIGWISQMTAILDKPESTAVHDILIDIASLYPQALVYPLMLSSEGYQFESSKAGRANQQLCTKLQGLVNTNQLVEHFIRELQQLDQPNAFFKEWFEEIIQTRDQNKIKEIARNLLPRFTNKETGLYWSKFYKKFSEKLDKVAAMAPKIMEPGTTKKEFIELCSKLTAEMRQASMSPPGTLKEYSVWLSNFNSNHFNETLEIPGQYTGLSKPLPEYHKLIASFQDSVLVMSSIRQPKRIIIRGNDENDYKYLCKCGEDLRQDQRIQMLLGFMNEMFVSDTMCRQRNMRIRTYQVIPMTPRLGMIEWMERTVPLKNIIEDAMTEDEKNLKQGLPADYKKMNGADAQSYLAAFQKQSVAASFRNIENKVPPDLLRRAYHKMSSGPEGYFKLRTNFAISHAQLCIAHYILGIGDRHQSNYMIDLDTGASVGIDFGHAFGSATQFLPVPELVPFRLTRQLRGLLEPMKEKGLIEGVMVHTLRALRANADSLLHAMDIFIQEPSLDWKQNAERQKKSIGMQGSDETNLGVDVNWYPRQKVDVARRKLDGDNCAHIMRSELKLGHGKKEAYKYMEAVLMGNSKDNARARLPEHSLSVEQQVEALLDLATDPNVLGRIWIGWESFM